MLCDGCTLCCKLLPVPWMNSAAGEQCSQCKAGVGCELWPGVPEQCAAFDCAYRTVTKASINVRPDRCRAIFERLTDDLAICTTAVVKGGEPVVTRAAMGQIRHYMNHGVSVVVTSFHSAQKRVYPATGVGFSAVVSQARKYVERHRDCC